MALRHSLAIFHGILLELIRTYFAFVKVYMFKNDYNAMCAEVFTHPHIETGGNLFGLWTTSGSAVIHVVLGPGQHCKRTSASFHQDLEYMERVGRFVNNNYMLCHIGEWHSHHNLSLNKPSAGDESTIRHNFPHGMSKFLVIIANIKNRDTVVLSPYFFTHGGERYEKAECVVLGSDSPFSNDVKILAQIEQGREDQQNETNRGEGASVRGTKTTPNTGSNSQRDDSTAPTYSQVASNPRNTGSNTQRHDSKGSTYRPSGGNANDVIPMETWDTNSLTGGSNPPADHTTAQTTNNPPGNHTANNEDEKATSKEVILKGTYDELEKFFGKGKVEMERTSNDDINMIFEHESYHWMLRFPTTFPDQPALLYRALIRHHLSSSSPCCDYYLEKPLTNHVNILLSIKKNCRLTCKICESISKEKLTKPVAVVIPDNTRPADVVQALRNEIEMTVSTPLSFASEAQNDGSYRIEFEHYQKNWSVKIPAEFPHKPAEVYKQESRYGSPQKKTINDSSMRHKQRMLISPNLIMLAIRSNCRCSQCLRHIEQV